jgi:hypothetical protein
MGRHGGRFARIALAAAAALLAKVARAGDPPNGARLAVDYEAGFAGSFPVVAGAHHVADWKLYTALVAGDIVTYAASIDLAVAKRFEQVAGKGYQTQQLEADIKQNKLLRAAFDRQRHELATMTLYADGDGTGRDTCDHPLVYIAKEFRLVLGVGGRGDDPLLRATVAPTCRQAVEPGFQITAGRSPRFTCWTASDITTCAWRLPDMPVDLKRVVESEYPGSVKVRWHWRGLRGVLNVRNGERIAERDRVVVTVPADLGLDFIDGEGRIRWTATSTGWSASGTVRERP